VTGGPGAGKTAALELARRVFPRQVVVLKEAASIVFGGGFPRQADGDGRRAAQRPIYHVQIELERMVENHEEIRLVLCDRGTVDGLAYWPDDAESFWRDLGTTLDEQIARYDSVIHLRSPSAHNGYEAHGLRVETATEAARIDARIAEAWERHPRRFFIESTHDFLEKASHAVALIGEELPPDCREQPLGPGQRGTP
jgi:hypothetical protein